MITTPIGTIIISATARGVSRVDLIDPAGTGGKRGQAALTRRELVPAGDSASLDHVRSAEHALTAYFEGSRDAFRDLPLDPEGTAFQRAVWEALRTIPYGETISYRALAERIGRPAAVRAVGLANGRNPIPIVVPCHRVIGADGSLTGFGLGVDVKAWLLVHEGVADALPAPVSAATRLSRRTPSLFP